MNKKRVLLTCLIVAALAITFSLVHQPSNEPSYNSHPLSYWIPRYVHPPNEDRDAKEAIEHIGTNAVPFLLEWMCYEEKPSKLRNTARKLLDKVHAPMSLQKWICEDPKEQRAQNSPVAFCIIMLPKPRQAVPELLRLLGRFSSSTNTAFQRVEGTLYCLQADEAVPLYLDYISDTRNPHRETVIGVLRQCHLGNNAAAASALLLKCLIGEDHPVAEAAGMALPEFCAPNTVQGLTNIFMTSTNAVIRNRAMWVLGMIGTPEIYSARNVILAGLRDPEEAVRQAATFALGRLEMEPSNAPIVITLLPASGTPAITMPSSAATNTPSNKGLSP